MRSKIITGLVILIIAIGITGNYLFKQAEDTPATPPAVEQTTKAMDAIDKHKAIAERRAEVKARHNTEDLSTQKTLTVKEKDGSVSVGQYPYDEGRNQ